MTTALGNPMTRIPVTDRSPLVDALPAVRHIERLLEFGMTQNMIARAAGISNQFVRDLRVGKRSRCRSIYADAILATDTRPSKHQSLVLNVGGRRRIEALQAVGWSGRAIAHEIANGNYCLVRRWRADPHISWESFVRIADVYERWSHLDGGNVRVKRWAASNGFIAPLMWDDIDDYFEVPGSASVDVGVDEVLVQRVIDGTWVGEIPSLERRAAFEKLHARGLSATEIAERLHVTPRTIERLRAAA